MLTNGYAQNPYFINYSVNDGLPGSENYDVIQDAKGYIWISGDAGVSRFDGYTFKAFTTENGLVDNTVFGMRGDAKGRIWFRTVSGRVGYYDNGKFYGIQANDTLEKISNASHPVDIDIDPQGNIFLDINTEMLLKIRPPYGSREISIKRYNTNDSGALYIIKPYRVPMVMVGLMDYMQTYDHVVFEALNNSRLEQTITNKTGHRLHQGKQKLYLSVGGSIFAYTGSRLTGTNSVGERIIALYEDREGNLWTGTFEHGIYVFQKGDLNTLPLHFFPKESVSSIMQDREGGIWFTSLKNGLFYLPHYRVLTYRETLLLDDSKVTSVTKAGGYIVAGKSNGELMLTDRNTMESVNYNFNSGHIGGVKTIGKDTVMVLGNHTFFFQSSKRKNLGFLKWNNLKMFSKNFEPYEADTFLASSGNEIYKVNKTNTSCDLTHKMVIPYSRINRLLCANKTIWIASTAGLWYCRKGIFNYCGDSLPLLKNRMEDIEILKDGKFLLATKAMGLIILDWPGKKTEVVSTADFLPSNTCKNLFLENDSLVWVCTNKGLSLVNFLTKKVRANYTTQQGLSSNEVNGVYADERQIWVATSHGLTCIPRHQSFQNKVPPPVYITGLKVNDKKIKIKNDLQFAPHSYRVAINFIGLSYQSLGKCMYKYKLSGLNNDWYYTTTPTVEYNSLAPGDYIFSVYALNSSRVSSSQPAVLRFTILAPFWQKAWFIVLVVVVFLLLVYWIFRIRLRRVKAREAKTAALDRALLALKLKALRAQMNPHFTFNVMNSIQHFMLAKDEESAHRYLSKFAKLIRLILQHSEEEMITVADEVKALELYLELETMRFENRFTYEIIVDKTINVNFVKLPSMLIQPYVENAVKHGIQPLKKEGRISIFIMDEVTELKCVIEDNGVGRKAATKLMAEKSHRSFGTSITQERLSVISQLNHLHLSEMTIDLHDAGGNATGTRVEIIIPKTEK